MYTTSTSVMSDASGYMHTYESRTNNIILDTNDLLQDKDSRHVRMAVK